MGAGASRPAAADAAAAAAALADLRSGSPPAQRAGAASAAALLRRFSSPAAAAPLAPPPHARALARALVAAAAPPPAGDTALGPAAVDAALAALQALAALAAALRVAWEAGGGGGDGRAALERAAAPLRGRALQMLVCRVFARDMRIAAAAEAALAEVVRAPPVRGAAWRPVAEAALEYRRAPAERPLRALLAGLSTIVHCVVLQSLRRDADAASPPPSPPPSPAAGAAAVVPAPAPAPAPSPRGRRRETRSRLRLSASTRTTLSTAASAASFAHAQHHQQQRKPPGPTARRLARDNAAAMAALAELLANARQPPGARGVVAAELVSLLADAQSGRRARAAGVARDAYSRAARAGVAAASPALYAAAASVLFRDPAAAAPAANPRCDLATARACLALLDGLLAAAPDAACTPRAPLLAGLSRRAQLLAASARGLAAEPASPAARRELADCLGAVADTLRTLTAACPRGAQDVQIELAAAACLRGVSAAGMHVSEPALRAAQAAAADDACLAAMRAWAALAAASPRGLLWERGPPYCAAVAVLARFARHAARVAVLRANVDHVTGFGGDAVIVDDGDGDRPPQEGEADVVPAAGPVAAAVTAAPPTRRGTQAVEMLVPSSVTFAPHRAAGAGAAADDVLGAVDLGDGDVELDASDDDGDVDVDVGVDSGVDSGDLSTTPSSGGPGRGGGPAAEHLPPPPLLPRPCECGLEIEERDRLGDAFAACVRALLAQCSARTVAHDVFRAIAHVYAADARLGGRGRVADPADGDAASSSSLPQFPALAAEAAHSARTSNDDAASQRLAARSAAPSTAVGDWFAGAEQRAPALLRELSVALRVLLGSLGGGGGARACVEEDVRAAESAALAGAYDGAVAALAARHVDGGTGGGAEEGEAEAEASSSSVGAMRAEIATLREEVDKMRQLVEEAGRESGLEREKRLSLSRRLLANKCLGGGATHNAARDVPLP